MLNHTVQQLLGTFHCESEETLAHMKAQRVISKVQQPTPWRAKTVVYNNKNGGVCMFVDLKSLNH